MKKYSMLAVLGLAGAALSGAAFVGCTITYGTESSAEHRRHDDDDGGSEAASATGLVAISETSLDFGAADCGGPAPKSQKVRLTNEGEGPLRWTAALDSTDFFSIPGKTAGTIAPGESATITVKAGSMPSTVAAGSEKRAALLVSTDDPLHPQLYVPLVAEARGASFELVTPVADFGQSPVGQAAPEIPLTLRNVGNAAAGVAIAAPSDPQFSFTWEGEGGEAVTVEPGEAMPGLAARFTPSGTAPVTSLGLVRATGPVCSSTASAIVLKGRGIAGVVGVSPAVLDFGKVVCGSQAEAQGLTIYNTGTGPLTWTAQVEGSRYSLSQESGLLLSGGSIQLAVIPAPLGMTDDLAENAFGSTVTITTDAEGDEPRTIELRQSAEGALLAIEEASLDFGTQPVFATSEPRTLSVVNEGNLAAVIAVQTESERVVVSPASGTAPAGGAFEAGVAFKPTALAPHSEPVTVSASGPLCQPFEAQELPVSGSGRFAASAVSVGANGGAGRWIPGRGGCAILKDSGGRVVCWGTNEYGQLGRPGEGTSEPDLVPDLTGIVSISHGGDFTCAVDEQGLVWCWGNNRNRNSTIVGKLGVTDVPTSATPVQVQNVSNAKQVSTGHNMACALLHDGTIQCWGSGRRGKLGDGCNCSHNQGATTVSGINDALYVAAGGGGACALRSDQSIYCWGRMYRGNIGSGSSSDTTIGPTRVSLNNAAAVAALTAIARGGPRCALNTSGSAYCWGYTPKGQMGTGSSSKTSYYSPTSVSGVSGATAIAAYYNGGCVLLGNKTIRCWGRNQHGQVGNGNTSIQYSSVAVPGIDDAEALFAGGHGACAIVSGDSVKCWGDYGFGTTTTPTTLPNF